MKIFDYFKIFILFCSAPDCIGAARNSQNPQEVAEFYLYLKEILAITTMTPHAEAHFFNKATGQPWSPPSKKNAQGIYELNFSKAYAVNKKTNTLIPYTVFTEPWTQVKKYLQYQSQEINLKITKNKAKVFIVKFSKPLDGHIINKIYFRNKKIKNTLEQLAKKNPFFINKIPPLTKKELKKRNDFLKKLKKFVVYSTQNSQHQKANFIVENGTLKTAYPLG